MEMPGPPQYPNHIVDSNMEALLKTTTELRLELQQTSLELASILLERGKRAQERVHASLLNSALTGDFEQLQMAIEKLTEHIDFVEDVAKLVSNKSRIVEFNTLRLTKHGILKQILHCKYLRQTTHPLQTRIYFCLGSFKRYFSAIKICTSY